MTRCCKNKLSQRIPVEHKWQDCKDDMKSHLKQVGFKDDMKSFKDDMKTHLKRVGSKGRVGWGPRGQTKVGRWRCRSVPGEEIFRCSVPGEIFFRCSIAIEHFQIHSRLQGPGTFFAQRLNIRTLIKVYQAQEYFQLKHLNIEKSLPVPGIFLAQTLEHWTFEHL